MLAEIRPSCCAFASVDATVLPELAGVPITAVLGDQQSALFGQACFEAGVVKATYGTGAFMLANVGDDVPGVVDGLVTTLAWDLGDLGPVSYALEGSAFVAGAAVQWLRDEMGFIEASSELESLALTCPDSGGVSFVPAFTGLGSPFWRSDARGSITGLSRGVGRAQIARALVESLAFQVRAMTDAFSAGGIDALARPCRRWRRGDGPPAQTAGHELSTARLSQHLARGHRPRRGHDGGTLRGALGFARRPRRALGVRPAIRTGGPAVRRPRLRTVGPRSGARVRGSFVCDEEVSVEEYAALVVRGGLGFGEAPRWHDGRLWYSDFYRRAIYSMAADGSDEVLEHEVVTQPSGLGWLPNGDLLCVSMIDQRVLRFTGAQVATFADISAYCEFWANDMAVSSSGHSYVGNFGFDLDTRLKELGVEAFLATPPPTTNLVVLDAERRGHPGRRRHALPQRHRDHPRRRAR